MTCCRACRKFGEGAVLLGVTGAVFREGQELFLGWGVYFGDELL